MTRRRTAAGMRIFLRVHRSNGKDNRKERDMLAKAVARIGSGAAEMEGMLELPPQRDRSALGIVLFAHGSGSSRLSPRNNYMARVLREAGIGTLLDLLTPDEERSVGRPTGLPGTLRAVEKKAALASRFVPTAWLPVSAAVPTNPSGIHRPRGPLAALRGSPTPPATGRGACRPP